MGEAGYGEFEEVVGEVGRGYVNGELTAVYIDLGPMPDRFKIEPVMPDHIPNIRHCDYLSERMFPSGVYHGEDDRLLTDDELDAKFSEGSAAASGLRFVSVPITHMAYDQGLREAAANARADGSAYVSIDRGNARLTIEGHVFAYRLAWLHSPGQPGQSFGSNNWTPERGAESAASREAFDELNKDHAWECPT
jgi:hypothetical protein